MDTNRLHAWQAAELMARRELRAEDLLRACLERIDARESLAMAERVGVGTGSYRKEDLESVTSAWRETAFPRRRVRRMRVPV